MTLICDTGFNCTSCYTFEVEGSESFRSESSLFSFLGAKNPRSESSREQEIQGVENGQRAKGPGSELARVLLANSFEGAKRLGTTAIPTEAGTLTITITDAADEGSLIMAGIKTKDSETELITDFFMETPSNTDCP